MRAGLPVDPAQWISLALAAAVIPAAPWLVRPAGRRAVFLAAASLAAAALSALYIAVYLRGGPRIIDATSYWLEARALAEGSLSFRVDEPVASTLGRFLVRSDDLEGARAAVIFPPGYPALLAVGFLAGVPLAVGPLLAAALVIATYDLAEQLLAPSEGSPSLARLAALFSVACAALRYHTADTMSHGLSALCFCGSLALFFRSLRADRRRLALAAASGLLLGWLAAARPFSSIALGLTLLAALATPNVATNPPRSLSDRLRLGAAVALGALPGLALLVAHQRAATGAWATSSQALYYAVSDGPPGCFRYGFGAGVGCLGEHGDFVRSYLPHGYLLLEAAGTTLRRLQMHLVDAANAEPLALLVPIGAALGSRAPRSLPLHAVRVRLLALALILQVAAYAPFYFDGNYPGGGARFFADVLPLEHVLASIAVLELSRRFFPRARPDRLAALALALALAGFSVRAGFDHAALRDREGGLPMFEPHRLPASGIERGLVFLDTDHGFNLAFDPARPSRSGLDFARFRGDATDRLAWEARGRPEAFRYRFLIPSSASERARVIIEPYRFGPELSSPHLFEAEILWPARKQEGAWALPEHASGTCATGGRWLAIHAASRGSVVVSLPAPWIAGRSLAPRVAVALPAPTPGALLGEVILLLDDREARRWPILAPSAASPEPACQTLPPEPVPPGARRVEIRLERTLDPPANPLKSNPNPSPLLPLVALDHVIVLPPEIR